jgi:hypothetical protein
MGWSSPVTVANAGKNFFPQIVSDGSTGAIISWLHKNSSGCYEVYARHVDASGNTGTAYPVSVKNDVTIGHRLNHHIVWSGSNAYSFWANHFNTAPTNDPYPRGYYLQQLSSSGAPQWPDPNFPDPVQVARNWPPIPASDGEPISICRPDGEGGCVVAMKHTRWGKPARIIVDRYTSSGTRHTGWPAGGLVVDSAETGELIGCPKVVQWNNKYMLIYVTATYAGTGWTSNNSITKLHLHEINTNGTKGDDHVRSFSYNDFYEPTDFGYSERWFWWVPIFDVAVSEDGTSIYVAYLKRQKRKWPSFVQPTPFYISDELFILRCTPQGFSYDDEKIDGWVVPHNYEPTIDELPLRTPSIACLSNDDGVVVVYPIARGEEGWTPGNPLDHKPPVWNYYWRAYGASIYPTRQFYLKAYKVTPSGSKSLLWTLTDGSYHTPHVISDGAGAYIVAYSQHQHWDYTSNTYFSKIYVDHYNPYRLQELWEADTISGGSNCSPQLLLTEEDYDNYVIVTWGYADFNSNEWSVKTQRFLVDYPVGIP